MHCSTLRLIVSVGAGLGLQIWSMSKQYNKLHGMPSRTNTKASRPISYYIIKYHIGSTSSSSSAAWEFIPATLDKDAMRLAVAKRETPNPAPSLAHGNRVLLLCLSLWHAFAAAVAACPTLCYNQSITREVQVTFHFKWSVDCRVCKVGTKTARIRMPGQGKWMNGLLAGNTEKAVRDFLLLFIDRDSRSILNGPGTEYVGLCAIMNSAIRNSSQCIKKRLGWFADPIL